MSTFRLHIEAARFRWERHEALSGSDRHSGDTATATRIPGKLRVTQKKSDATINSAITIND